MVGKKPRKKATKKKNEKMYLVDYDIAQKNKKCKQEFYRKINTPEFKTAKSSKSVLLVKDKKKAQAINKKASSCGRSNIYSVQKIE
jgi:hypothetical protein